MNSNLCREVDKVQIMLSATCFNDEGNLSYFNSKPLGFLSLKFYYVILLLSTELIIIIALHS